MTIKAPVTHASRGGKKLMLPPKCARYGHSLKTALREVAKRLPLYHEPVETNPPLVGETDRGEVVPVNTLGRWIFGVPGCVGHAIFDPEPAVYLPPDAPPEAEALIWEAVKLL
jgi:hypothetical protein